MVVRPVVKRSRSMPAVLCNWAEGVSARAGAAAEERCGEASVRPKADDENQGVQDCADAQCSVKAIKLDQEKRNDGAGNRAEDVGQIKEAERAARVVIWAAADGEHGQRYGRAHAGAPRNQRQRQPGARNKVVGSRGDGNAVGHSSEQMVSPGQLQRHSQRRNGNQKLAAGVQTERVKSDSVTITPHQRSGDPGTGAQAAHEDGQHDGDQRRRDSEGRHRQPKPHQFVQDAAKPGDEEEDEEPGHSPHYTNTVTVSVNAYP